MSLHWLLDADRGFTVPVNTEATRLLIQLEGRGITVTGDGAGLRVRPAGQLCSSERASLLRLKRHVLHLLAYQPPGQVHSSVDRASDRAEPDCNVGARWGAGSAR